MGKDLHSSAPDKCTLARLLTDVINDVELPKGELVERAAPGL